VKCFKHLPSHASERARARVSRSAVVSMLRRARRPVSLSGLLFACGNGMPEAFFPATRLGVARAVVTLAFCAIAA
jgi:hypothetical protein